MEKAFVYGMSVSGSNFTDRVEECRRIKMDFENGINVILISPRRMGKTSLIKKVMSQIAYSGRYPFALTEADRQDFVNIDSLWLKYNDKLSILTQYDSTFTTLGCPSPKVQPVGVVILRSHHGVV